MRLSLSAASWATIAACAICVACINPSVAHAEGAVFNGDKGGEIKFKGDEIKLVDGKGNWVIIGMGQDVTITEKKDGDGNLTLKGFGKITIKEKNGNGKLIIEDDNKEVVIEKVDGKGLVYLRNKGKKEIEDKNGPCHVYYKGEVITNGKKDGTGEFKREDN